VITNAATTIEDLLQIFSMYGIEKFQLHFYDNEFHTLCEIPSLNFEEPAKFCGDGVSVHSALEEMLTSAKEVSRIY